MEIKSPDFLDEPFWTCLLEEDLPSVAAAANIFANAPGSTRKIYLTLRSGTLTVTFNGTTAPTASSHGNDFAANTGTSPYVFYLNQAAALLVKAIQATGTVTGHITYWGE